MRTLSFACGTLEDLPGLIEAQAGDEDGRSRGRVLEFH
jgi:hypothetical protein